MKKKKKNLYQYQFFSVFNEEIISILQSHLFALKNKKFYFTQHPLISLIYIFILLSLLGCQLFFFIVANYYHPSLNNERWHFLWIFMKKKEKRKKDKFLFYILKRKTSLIKKNNWVIFNKLLVLKSAICIWDINIEDNFIFY